MEVIIEELGIPKKYLKSTCKEDRFIALVHKTWIKSLVKYLKLSDFIERNDKLEPWYNEDTFWEKIFIRILPKREAQIIPLPKISNFQDENPLLFAQILQYITQTNYKNLFKDALRKYSSEKALCNREKQISLVDYNEALKETLVRIYGCPIVNTCDNSKNIKISDDFEAHLNVLPSVCCVETLNSLFVLHIPYIEHNLNNCVNFSPAILEKCYSKPLFIVYQLLNAFRSLHNHSLTVGDINLNDIYMTDDLWIYIFPKITSNLCIKNAENEFISAGIEHDCKKNGHEWNFGQKCSYCGILSYDKVQIGDESLEQLCKLWIDGKISNFTYLTALNNFSGRRLGDPNCHHVFPWVSDFASRCGKNWRDLKKSKFRINKGDRQLDLTYEGTQTQVSHHVSDVLSAITYYVYMARRTSKSVLCKNVRTIWVPAEYPSSIQRMQEWTPDECIPEFFTDPGIFRSIHNDLDDLEVPIWCSGPEDFIEKHREALESQHVSERLHHWIDLTFGYKLSGNAAVKAKNVCLHLADDHTNLTKSGVVQLFTQPHPPRYSTSHNYATFPLKMSLRATRQRNRERTLSSATESSINYEDEIEDSTISSNIRAPSTTTRFLSQSRTSPNELKISKSPSRSSSVGPKTITFTSHVAPKPKNLMEDLIPLPKDYKPEAALESLEKKHTFFTKTFHPEASKSMPAPVEHEEVRRKNFVQNSFTNFIYSDRFEASLSRKDNLRVFKRNVRLNGENFVTVNVADIISNRRVQELQVMGCLIVEIFMSRQLKALGINRSKLTLNDRIKFCTTVLRGCPEDIPPCISYIANFLLQPDKIDYVNFKYPPVTVHGLPPPNAHLLLEPLISYYVPFPKHFAAVYRLLGVLKNFCRTFDELQIRYHFDCDGTLCCEYESVERTKILLAQNISECKVKACAKLIEEMFLSINTTTDVEVINILLPYVKELIEDPPTSVLAAWYLFDPMSRVLGPQRSSEILLDSVLKLYENEPNETTLPYYGRIAKLYHHSFLLRLIVRLGLRRFLENFTAPLVEAVGGYKDYEKVDFVLHDHNEKISKRTSHLKSMDKEQQDDQELSETQHVSLQADLIREEEVFDFEEEKMEQMKSLMEHLELNVSSDLPFNHSSAEEALDATLTENVEHLRNLEELRINIGQDCDPISSPTIPIPSYKTSDVDSINCEIGSRKSENDSLFEKKLSGNEAESPENKRASSVSSGSERRSKRRVENKISDMSSDSLIWLSHRLGPVLTARYLSRNLLKMLTLCYVGKENLVPSFNEYYNDIVSVTGCRVIGDENSAKVLECLANIAGLYGEQFILFQYIPHMSELIALCKKKLNSNLEGGLISCLALLKQIIPYLSDSTLMEQLQDNILKNIIHPTVRLLGSTKYVFPSDYIARQVLAQKYLDALYVISIRIGADMARTHLAVPALQRFFTIFDKVHFEDVSKSNEKIIGTHKTKADEDNYLIELKKDGTSEEWVIGGDPVCISQALDSESSDSFSQLSSVEDKNLSEMALEELAKVFTPEMAHTAYIPFLKHLGAGSLEISLKNHDGIKALCLVHEQEIKSSIPRDVPAPPETSRTQTMVHSGSIGSNVAVIGNRIEVQGDMDDNPNYDLLNVVSNKMENSNRHLRGNWLAYWGHEIGRSDKDNSFNFKQIKLQTFSGHTHSVKCLHVLDNENSFMSGSRDKTVKLWSLRSQGDGSSVSACQWTYTAHKKSVLALTFIEGARLAASCDSIVHIWDPFMGVNVGLLESPRYAPVNILKAMPAPSSMVFAATTDGTLKSIDTRICSYIYELKVNSGSASLIRCLAIPQTGSWIAAGQSSGYITVLDSRTGLIISSWRAHEGEVLQLVSYDDSTLISSSLDQTVIVWNVSDGKLKFYLRGATEPVHCLNLYNRSELITGSTANRIGVHTSIHVDASFSSTKLRSDTFRGLLTSMALLPLNRLLLLGADNGNISLLC